MQSVPRINPPQQQKNQQRNSNENQRNHPCLLKSLNPERNSALLTENFSLQERIIGLNGPESHRARRPREIVSVLRTDSIILETGVIDADPTVGVRLCCYFTRSGLMPLSRTATSTPSSARIAIQMVAPPTIASRIKASFTPRLMVILRRISVRVKRASRTA